MTDIEFVVSFVALLGGLLLANVANNLADALRSRRDLPIGFVPWAINFYISAGFVTGFTLFWAGRDTLSFDMLTLISQLAVFGPYIMASRLLYPEHKDRWASVEEYYIANRKLILGVLLIAPSVFGFNILTYEVDASMSERVFNTLVAVVPVVATLVLLMLTENRRWHWAGWGFLTVHRIASMIWLAITVG